MLVEKRARLLGLYLSGRDEPEQPPRPVTVVVSLCGVSLLPVVGGLEDGHDRVVLLRKARHTEVEVHVVAGASDADRPLLPLGRLGPSQPTQLGAVVRDERVRRDVGVQVGGESAR